ncbi:sugar ABC transporter substrate-binding protein [Salimicrobium halophilum]|uniref:Multiple sugar transport system substrate-binding protein n=1 Tax=Salimicrobium halophilum TaxID=86666 RepID=A0A1G8S9C7_9BACI|nr:sugar ABC transporter substrate-binding protein [Salimicrobium halophilum]SDJ25838.1 multiple sugar transport system substrate-binding protein [Salimicrobium halophilum]
MKNVWYLLIILMLGTLLAACSSEGEGSSGDESEGGSEGDLSGEITVWTMPFSGDSENEEKMWNNMASTFEEEHGVSVNMEQIPWSNRDQKILTALAAGSGPDVFYAIPDQMPQYAEEGMLLELDPYLEGNNMDDFADSAMESVTWDDSTYGLPILQEAYTLFYNLDIVKEIGGDPENLPKNWEEFKALAAKAKENGYYATSFPGGGSMNGALYPWIWQAGGTVLSKDGEVGINSDQSVEAFELINTMYEKEWIPQDSVTAMHHNELWEGGEMLAVTGSGINLQILQKSGEMDFEIAAPLKKEEQATYGTTGMFVVPSNSGNPDAAAEFVKYMTNAENQRTFNELTKYIPTRESAKDIFEDEPKLDKLAGFTEYTKPGVIHPAARDIMSPIQSEVQAMLEGDKSPQEAADAAAEAIEQQVGK